MKKIKIAQIVGIILFIIYIGLFIIDLIWGILGKLDILIFSILLAVVSIWMIYKGVLLKSGSTLWFALSLILFAILIMTLNLLGMDINDNYYIFSLIPLISSVFILLIFRYIIYIKLIILLISTIIPIFTSKFFVSTWWINAIIGSISIITGIIICRNLNLGEEKV